MKLIPRFSNRSKLLIVSALLALGVVAVPAIAKATLGSDRPTKVYTQGVAGFDYPTFNSFTNVPNIGDERNFFNGMYPDSSAYTDPMPQLRDGEEITLEVYVHNGADPSLNAGAGTGIARDTSVRVALPSSIAKSQQAEAFISSSNANPTVVSDTLNFGAENGGYFSLAYEPGTAHVKGNYIDAALPDSVVTTGAKIGTDALDGNVKGCFEQMVVVTLKVKVNMPRYTINKTVDTVGHGKWIEHENANPGDKVAWQIAFNNAGATDLNHVDIVDQVPAGLTVVPGSIKLINGNYPNGTVLPDSAIQDNGRTVHVNIGNYAPGDNAYVYYTTTVDKPADTVCSPQTLVNKAFATPESFGAIWDDADVTVPGNTCKTQVSYSCDAFTLTVDNASRTVKVATAKTSQSAGVTFDNFTIDWSDKTPQLMSDSPVGKTHQFAGNGTYTITAVAHFTTPTGAATNTNANCAQTVSFTSTPQTPNTPTSLPNTGAGSVAALFGAVSAAAAFGYRLFLGRRISE